MPILVLHPRYDEDSQLLWQAAVSRGWDVCRTDYRQLAEIENMRSYVRAEGPTIYGGDMWATQIAGALGVKLLSPPDDWLLTLPYKFTRRAVGLSTVGEVRANGPWPLFVKALRGKSLASRVYHSAEDIPDVGDDTEIIVQKPICFEREYRLFILMGRVITWSVYANHGELYTDNENSEAGAAAAYTTRILRDLRLPAACVVDVGEIEGVDWFDRWAVVEANPAWCSAVYGCDPGAALDVIAASCISVRPPQ
jgi:hypothetical protein